MSVLVTLSGIVTGLIALDVAALLWGADSRERPESPEWNRRAGWYRD